MADKGKRKYQSWIYSKETKIPRTTAWRRKNNVKESTDGNLASNLSVTTLHHDEEASRSDGSAFSFFDNSASIKDFESDQCFPPGGGGT